MTYCLAITLKDGLIALADRRITAGTYITQARKISMMHAGNRQFFVMTSGLRSIRDKTLAYMQRDLDQSPHGYESMLDIISVYTRCLRQVEEEDRKYIEQGELSFNSHSIVGGQMEKDSSPKVYLVYPEGNWVEVEKSTPFVAIGAVGYGKPILDRTLTYDTDMKTALKVAYLSFDSTRFSSSDVGFPIDMVTYSNKNNQWQESHLVEDDLRELRLWWNENISGLVTRSPDGVWLNKLLP